ncbi:MAG: hypothetical protein ACTSVC_07915 [Promethearchaeota archaeon]
MKIKTNSSKNVLRQGDSIRIFLFLFMILILPLFYINSFMAFTTASSFKSHVTIDGINDWPSSSIIIADNRSDSTGGSLFEIYDVYANYTEDYIYFGVSLNSSNTGDLFIALDYDTSNAHAIKQLVWAKRVNFTESCRPELIIVLDDEAVQAWDNSTGTVARNATIESHIVANAVTTFHEIKILRSDLGNINYVNISVIETATEDNKAAIDIAPDDPGVNSTGDRWNDWDIVSTFYKYDLSAPNYWNERSMTLDGNLNDFTDDELVINDSSGDTSNDGGDIYNVSVVWNSTHVFFGVHGPILSASGGVKQHTMFIAIDTGSGGGLQLPWNRTVSFANDDSAPNYVACLGEQTPGSGLTAQLYNLTNGIFTYKEDIALSYLGWANNSFTEFGIPLSSLGDPASINFSVIVTGRNNGTSAIDVFPDDPGVNKWYNDDDNISNYQYSAPGILETITCDGDDSDWSAQDYYPNEIGDTIAVNADIDKVYCTWDESYIYLGINGTDPHDSAEYKTDLFIAIDYKAGGGTGNFWAKNINFGGDFLPDYIIGIENELIYQILSWNGTQWKDVTASMVNFGIFISFNTEIRISKENITSDDMNISVFVTPDGDNTSAIDVAPNTLGFNYLYTMKDNITNGEYISHLNTLHWKPYDALPPIITGPADFSVEQYAPNISFTWHINERHPDTFRFYFNGTPIPVSFNETLIVPVPTNNQGKLNYTIWINDSNGQWATDEVIINMTEPVPPSFIEDTLKAETFNNGYYMLNSSELIAGFGFLDKDDINVSINVTETIGFDTVIMNYTITDTLGNSTEYQKEMTTCDTGITRKFVATIPASQLNDSYLVSLSFWANDTQGAESYLNNSEQFYNFTIDANAPTLVSSPNISSIEQYQDLSLTYILNDIHQGAYRLLTNISGSMVVYKDWTSFINNVPFTFNFEPITPGQINFTLEFKDAFNQLNSSTLIVEVIAANEQYLPTDTMITLNQNVTLKNIVCNSPYNLTFQELYNGSSSDLPAPPANITIIVFYNFTISFSRSNAIFSADLIISLDANTSAMFEENSLKLYRYNTQTHSWDALSTTYSNGQFTYKVTGFSLYAVGGVLKTSTSGETPSGNNMPDITKWVIFIALGVVAVVATLSLVSLNKKKRQLGEITEESAPKKKPGKKANRDYKEPDNKENKEADNGTNKDVNKDSNKDTNKDVNDEENDKANNE